MKIQADTDNSVRREVYRICSIPKTNANIDNNFKRQKEMGKDFLYSQWLASCLAAGIPATSTASQRKGFLFKVEKK